MGRRGRRLVWKPTIRPLFKPVKGRCFIGFSKELRTPIDNTDISEFRASNEERLKALQVQGNDEKLFWHRDVKTLLDSLELGETTFVSPLKNQEATEDWQTEDRTDSTHLNFMDLQLHTDYGICSAATRFGLLGVSSYSVMTKPEFESDKGLDVYRAMFSEPGWFDLDSRLAAGYENENIVDGESYAIWRWTRDTVASIVSAWRSWKAIQETPSKTHEILKKLYALHSHTLYFLPPELNSEHYQEPDVIPYYPEQENFLGQLPELPSREELKKPQYQLEKDFLGAAEERVVAHLYLYCKSSIARLLETTQHKLLEEHDEEIKHLLADFHKMKVGAVNEKLDDYHPKTETGTLQGHIVNCLSHHVIPPPGTNAPRFSCCAQCHKWTRVSGRSRIKVWGGKLYCSPSCRSASALMATRLKDPETNNVNFKLLLEATERVDSANSDDWKPHERSDAKKERPDREVILGRLITSIYENFRRNMSVDRLLEGHFRIKDSNSEDYARLKRKLEDVRQAGQDYPYFDWDPGVPE